MIHESFEKVCKVNAEKEHYSPLLMNDMLDSFDTRNIQEQHKKPPIQIPMPQCGR